MPTPQGARRGDDDQVERRRGGGDWDANAADLERWVEVDPGERCRAWSFDTDPRPVTDGEPLPDGWHTAKQCTNTAPVGSSICTPCHRERIADTYRRRSLSHRQRIAEQTGRPLESIQ